MLIRLYNDEAPLIDHTQLKQALKLKDSLEHEEDIKDHTAKGEPETVDNDQESDFGSVALPTKEGQAS